MKYEKVLTKKDYEKTYENFDEFCKTFTQVKDVMYWYKYNKIKWPGCKIGEDDPNDKSFAWPDDILRDKIGNCLDHAIFFYYFCKKHNIDVRLYRFAVYLESIFADKYWCEGHILCIAKLESGYYACDYYTKPNSNLYGPFKSFEDCAKNYAENYYMNIILEVKFGEKRFEYQYDTVIDFIGPYYTYMDNNGLSLLDKYYGNKKITQNEINELDISTTFEYDGKRIKKNIFLNTIYKWGYYLQFCFRKLFER